MFSPSVYILFCFFNGKKEKQTKKVCTFFCEKGIIIIVHFFLELYFFSGIIFFFRGYIFLVPGFVVFFSFLALNPLEPIIFEYTNFFRGTDFPTWKNQKLAAQHQQLSTNIVSKQKELYFWGPSNLRNHSFKNYSSGKNGTIFLEGPQTWKNNSFKNYSSGKKGTIFLGGHPNLRKHSFKNYSSGKKGTIFLGWPPTLKKHNFKNYSSGKKGTIFLRRSPNLKKHSFQNYSSGKKRNYIFGSVPNVQKNSFKNYSSGKKGTIFGRAPKPEKTQLPKLLVPEKKELYFWEGTQTWEKTQLQKL